MKKNLVIVESPSKSKTIENYLGKDYVVTSSKGHIRDLSKSGKERLGIDPENNYEPKYSIPKDKSDVVKELKKLVKSSSKVYLATDPDREGEAISWHLAQVLGVDMEEDNRIIFNEITKDAVVQALNQPRKIDQDLVHSQETRRVLDRIIGFKLSRLLQKKIKSKSAGRVQSVALRLIVEKEREIEAFIPEEYWKIRADFEKDDLEFSGELSKYNNKKIEITNGEQAQEIYDALDQSFVVENVKTSLKKRESKLPFITSTLQQEASSKLGYKARRTMSIAQKLYEGINLGNETVGLITYMRTDSTRLSQSFVNEALDYVKEKYGPNYAGKPKVGKKKDNVQDAHEGIRPTSVMRTPESVKGHLKDEEFKLYSLIYARAVASLMSGAQFDATSIVLNNNGYQFNISGSVLKFDGYLRLYGPYEKQKNEFLPLLEENQNIDSTKIEKSQHFTKPPARYSEAKLIKTMEELGIGRPSTYASIIDTIQARAYVVLEDKAFKPTEDGVLTSDKLTEYFDKIINVEYTASMENQLDDIAIGEDTYVGAISNFVDEFNPLLENAYDKMEEIGPEKTGEQCPDCGHDLVVRKGRFGKFVACESYPECKYIKKDPVVVEYTGENCPNCNSAMIFKTGRFGKFEACSNYPTCKYIKGSKQPAIPVETGENCPNCGKPIIIKRGRWGDFKACSDYPKCKTIIKDKKEPKEVKETKKTTTKKKAE